MARIRAHVTYANVAATLALVLAMSGGAIAATGGFASGGTLRACVNDEGRLKLLEAGKRCGKGKKTVSWNQNGPAGSKGATGAPGTAGANGINGTNGVNANEKVVVRTTRTAIGANSFEGAGARCLPGERAISGGLSSALAQVDVEGSFPVVAGNKAAAEGETPTGWDIEVHNATASEDTVTTFVECAS
jgi:hypothetical protein